MDPRLTYYIDRYTSGSITPEELDALALLLKEPANRAALHENMAEVWQELEQHQLDFSDVTDRVEAAVFQRINASEAFLSQPVRRMLFRRVWGWVAAAVFIAAVAGAYLYTVSNREIREPKNVQATIDDVAPGSNKALLTLSDGTTIVLDNAANGVIAQQGAASIVKKANGEIAYNGQSTDQHELLMNTMTTPRGGQYQLVLPDGSKIWLNAASSVTYPAVFADKERKIKVTGEVYLEVATDKLKPFLVDIDGRSSVEVLGTSFNINSYTNEDYIKTTLLEGSVRVGGATVLQPGYQAIMKTTGTAARDLTVKAADVQQVLAWKNGMFNFNGVSLYAAMKQMERWYNIEVKYEGTLPNIEFSGKMDRGVKLSTILRFLLTEYGLHSRLEGKTVIMEGR